MEIAENHTEESQLVAICSEGVDMLCSGAIAALVERFNYALAYDREPAEAFRNDLQMCLNKIGAENIDRVSGAADAEVTYYKENSTNLYAVVGLRAIANNGREVLIEFVVTSAGAQKHLTLEEVSAL